MRPTLWSWMSQGTTGVLLLLGIRAAVRRSVTIVCTQQERSSRLWDDLPFNLRADLVSFHDEAHSGPSELLRALRAGLTQSDISPRYLDLPVYDYVRANPGETGTVDPAWVLLLRALSIHGGPQPACRATDPAPAWGFRRMRGSRRSSTRYRLVWPVSVSTKRSGTGTPASLI